MARQFAAEFGQWILGFVCLVLVATSPLMAQQAGPPQAQLGVLSIPPGPLMGMAFGFVVLVLLLWGIKQPLAWIVVSFLAIGFGLGCAGYGCAQAALASEPLTSQQVEWVSSFIGGGVGGTVAGIVLLVVSLLRRRKGPEMNH